MLLRNGEKEATMSPQDSSRWIKSTLSGNSNCVEWRFSDKGVSVRDSKNPGGPQLDFTEGEWQAFVGGVRAGEADLPRS